MQNEAKYRGRGSRMNLFSWEIESVVIVSPKGSIAFGTLALPRFVAGAQAVEAKDVKALGQDGILPRHFAAGAR